MVGFFLSFFCEIFLPRMSQCPDILGLTKSSHKNKQGISLCKKSVYTQLGESQLSILAPNLGKILSNPIHSASIKGRFVTSH